VKLNKTKNNYDSSYLPLYRVSAELSPSNTVLINESVDTLRMVIT